MTTEVASIIRILLCMKIALVIIVVSVSRAMRYSYYFSYVPVSAETLYISSAETSYIYESRFSVGELGVLDISYWVVDPQLISGAHYIEDGMLKIESDNRYQVGFGMKWKSPTYEKGDWEPWLPVFWKYHVDATFVKPEGDIACLVIENWIALETGESITAMVWYRHGSLMCSYGAFPNDGGYTVLLGQFALPSEFDVTIDADYKARSMVIDWNNHNYNVPLQIERIGPIPKPFTHFQITLMEPGIIYIKNLKVVLF